jgi:hypothetical protein
MKGIYQHCSEKHLQRYLAEFDFRYSNRIALGVDDQAGRTRRSRATITIERTDVATISMTNPTAIATIRLLIDCLIIDPDNFFNR